MSDQHNSFPSWVTLLLSTAVVATAITGCGVFHSSGDREVISTPAWTSSSRSDPDRIVEESQPPSKAEVARDRAAAAYRGMWADLVAAGRTSDWDSPRLDDHATHTALGELSLRLRANHSKGLVTRGKIDQNFIVEQSTYSEPKALAIIDCVDDLKLLTYKADTGELVDGPRGRHRVMALVTLQDDQTWKVFRFSVDEVGTC